MFESHGKVSDMPGLIGKLDLTVNVVEPFTSVRNSRWRTMMVWPSLCIIGTPVLALVTRELDETV
jgi:hypothetical protein